MKNESECLSTGKRDGERGASLIEYALLVSLISLISIVSVKYLGGNDGEDGRPLSGIAGSFQRSGNELDAAMGSICTLNGC